MKRKGTRMREAHVLIGCKGVQVNELPGKIFREGEGEEFVGNSPLGEGVTLLGEGRK